MFRTAMYQQADFGGPQNASETNPIASRSGSTDRLSGCNPESDFIRFPTSRNSLTPSLN
ncbi:hypothetical protein N7572_23300 [Enterobacter roggenkampii]|uniref:hypothetical protein n=1 Tax=Enterobacter cloacae complex TaxID=354276 RepID=UPI00224B9969|nr:MULTISPECIES: hypothetical protein [Enterobacter cloacae complex]MDG9871462.1 hypothetical protein [Enterobacter roggenkampii]UZQ67099.1 hypothetical protein OQE50_19710 [Enterobacter kobei]UZQ68110.1 hypothetical protein OQE50_01890 [Enterobacter kobei]HDT6075142.1 hypothetical protein [Enterobacter roggenkampii]